MTPLLPVCDTCADSNVLVQQYMSRVTAAPAEYDEYTPATTTVLLQERRPYRSSPGASTPDYEFTAHLYKRDHFSNNSLSCCIYVVRVLLLNSVVKSTEPCGCNDFYLL